MLSPQPVGWQGVKSLPPCLQLPPLRAMRPQQGGGAGLGASRFPSVGRRVPAVGGCHQRAEGRPSSHSPWSQPRTGDVPQGGH